MQPGTRRWLVRAAWAVGALVAIAAALAGYMYSLLPEPIGDPPTLQTELFVKPAQTLPVSGRYVGKSATELAALIKSRQATSTEIVREHLHHIRNTNHRTNAFVWLFEPQALAAAAEADRKVARAPQLDESIHRRLMERASTMGFDTARSCCRPWRASRRRSWARWASTRR